MSILFGSKKYLPCHSGIPCFLILESFIDRWLSFYRVQNGRFLFLLVIKQKGFKLYFGLFHRICWTWNRIREDLFRFLRKDNPLLLKVRSKGIVHVDFRPIPKVMMFNFEHTKVIDYYYKLLNKEKNNVVLYWVLRKGKEKESKVIG